MKTAVARRSTLAALWALALSVPLLGGCGGIDVDFWDEREFEIDVPAGAPTRFTQTRTVNLADNKDIKDNLQHVKGLKVSEVWLETSKLGATNAATSAGGKLEVSATAEGSPLQLVGEYQGLPITEGGKLHLTATPAQLKVVEGLAFTAPNAFKVHYTASFNEVPAKFHVKARIHFVATVGF